MRQMLMAAVCLTALTGPAVAQGVPVWDAQSIFQQIQSYVQQGKAYVLQAQQYATQAEHLHRTIMTYEAFVHDPSLGRAVGLINRAGYGNSLPINLQAVQSLASGQQSLNGLLGKLGQLANTNYSANHIYSPTDGSWNSQQLIANGNAIASVQGMAQSAYDDLRNHLPIIQALQDRLSSATTPKDVQDAQAALAAEAAWTQNLETSVRAIEVNYRASADSRIQRDNESLTKGIDSFLAEAAARGRGL